MKNGTQKNHNNTTPDPMFDTFKEMRRFMQDQLAPSPKPKEIEHVVLDADDTIWEIRPWGMVSLTSPIGTTDQDTLAVALRQDKLARTPEIWRDVAPTGEIKLKPTLRDTLDKLDEKGISVSIACINNKRAVLEHLDAFGLTDRFVDVEANYTDSKGEMVKKIAKRQNIDTEKMLFVDDALRNALDVATRTRATTLIMGYNIQTIADILEFIK